MHADRVRSRVCPVRASSFITALPRSRLRRSPVSRCRPCAILDDFADAKVGDFDDRCIRASRKISSVCAPGSGSGETTLAGVRDMRDRLADHADVAAPRDDAAARQCRGAAPADRQRPRRACRSARPARLAVPAVRATAQSFGLEDLCEQGRSAWAGYAAAMSALAYSGARCRDQAGSSATHSARHWPSPPTPILMKPSAVSETRPWASSRDGRCLPGQARAPSTR